MRAQSNDKARERAERRALVEALIAADLTECQVGAVLMRALREGAVEGDTLPVEEACGACHMSMEGLHERRKRSAVGSLRTLVNLMPCCNPCNLWIEDHPAIAHQLGLVVRPGDDDWFLCGADHG